MVARSAPTLRFSSVRHRDPPSPAPSFDPSKIPSFAHDTTIITTTTKSIPPNPSTVTTRRNAVVQQRQRQQQKHLPLQDKLKPLKQSKLPFPPAASSRLATTGSGGPAPPPFPPRQPTKTISVPERPFRKAKLDGRHHDQASTTGPAKLPLRSRDSQGLLLLTPGPSSTTTSTTTTSAASRTRSATATATAAGVSSGGGGGHTTAINKNTSKPTTPALSAPPRSPASGISRTTRKSAHSHQQQHHKPVAVSEDVEAEEERRRKKKREVNDIMIADDDYNDNNDKYKHDRTVNNLLKGDGVSPSMSAAVGREKRSLRSNDGGSRSKSELAMYFQNYEQILSLEPMKPEFLSADTTVLLIDDLTQPIVLDPTPTSTLGAKLRGKHDKGNLPNGQMAQSLVDNPVLDLHDAQIIDLRPCTHHGKKPSKDPLDDDVYFKAHRRIERQEKQLRNIERERAQHEKVQLDRLLDELQGHDWLRVMGISGITETEKKLYEPKRAYFIKEVSALIHKFRAWKEEERRRKIERDQYLADEDDDDEGEDEEEDDNEENETEDEDEDEDVTEEAAEQSSIGREDASPQLNRDGELESFSPNFQTYGEPPDINDVDAWAARQLHQEAISASSNTARHSNLLPKHISIPPPHPSSQFSSSSPPSCSSSSPTSTSTSYPAPASRDSDRAARAPSPATTHSSAPTPTTAPPTQQPQQQPPAQPEPKPFTSFYTKRHLRDAAVGKIRRSRSRTAFGQPLPEIAAREFRLPADILTEEAVGACQRKKRRLRRAWKG
ncbi:hypothetical protein ACJ73_05109 [Blastomyces percursus]|uniref:Something about silencing protein 4 domain-containing protein n=1 Tax=Blastomyces percursus TaxID=1658174 RepID=A0A1J9QTI0_9EURO|nr:hypothetical protein ACJ73_05109 [Blastomyces percursus]